MSLLKMKPKNHPQQVAKLGHNDAVDTRLTPSTVFSPLMKEFGFTLDVAASFESAKTPHYYDRNINGLTASWGGETVWCNPPYSDIGAWIDKAWTEHRNRCPLICMLLPANRTEQPWWQDLVEPFRDGRGPIETRFIRSRIRFERADRPAGRGQPFFASVLLIWRATA